MATAAPKQSERKMEASSNLFEGLQTVNINLPIAPSHPVILSPSQGVEESDTAEESTSLLGDTSRSNVIEKAQVQDTSSEKFSKLYASEVLLFFIDACCICYRVIVTLFFIGGYS